MVFRGRPSENCHSCRDRRIKCDRLRPGCTQCTNKHIPCPGYRPSYSVYFHDETLSVARKVQARKRKQLEELALEVRSVPSHPCIDAPATKAPRSATGPVPRSVQLPVDYIAITFLLSHYLQWSTLDCLSNLYNASSAGSPLFVAVHASAIAALAVEREDASLMTMARTQYTKALQRTNAALASPEEFLDDGTLASILHLSLFEAIVFDDRSSPHNWTAHVNGAVELLKRRGHSQFETSTGRDLYKLISADIRVSCIQRQIRIPQDLLDYDSQITHYFNNNDPIYRYRLVFDEFAQLRCTKSSWKNEDYVEIVTAAAKIDERLKGMAEILPPEWQYRAVPDAKVPPGAHQGRADQYPNPLVAKHWNSIRTMRLFVNCWIVDFLRSVASTTKTGTLHTGSDLCQEQMLSECTSNYHNMIIDILSSVPQFITPTATKTCRFLIMPLSAIGEELLVPIAVAASASGC
ncbi:hypothetical protein BJ170DRAFT_181357 [Xylariales sp. AK1849]|nr:hypothetical protein BJ170DRAFT_181357 [Xylariales sp. AK1849]